MVLVQVVEHIAAFLGLEGTLVRERNFMRPKTVPPHWPILNDNTSLNHSMIAQHASSKAPSSAEGTSPAHGVKQNLNSMGEQERGAKHEAKREASHQSKEVLCGRYITKGSDTGLQDDKSRASPSGRYARLLSLSKQSSAARLTYCCELTCVKLCFGVACSSSDGLLYCCPMCAQCV